MNASTEVRVPARPALRRLVAADLDRFAAHIWGQAPLFTRAVDLPGDFTDLLDADAVDELISRRGLRTPFLRVAKDGQTFGDRAFTAGGGIGATVADQLSDDKLVRLFADGATMVLQGLHRMWPPVIDFAQQLAADLGHPTQVNAYVTPPQSRGFSNHYDVHDVFVLQIAGEKRWLIHRPVHPAPLRDQPWTDHRAEVEAEAANEPLLDVVLKPGDCLYLPRGYLHSATALGGVSIHLTVGMHVWTRYSLAEQLVAAALVRLAEDPEVRGPLGLEPSVGEASAIRDDVELIRSRLLDAVRNVSEEIVADRLRVRAREAQRAAPIGPLAQLRAAAALDDTVVLQLRPHLKSSLVVAQDGSAVLHSRAGDLRLGAGDVACLHPCLAGETVRAGDLGLDLARRLLRAGVVVAKG